MFVRTSVSTFTKYRDVPKSSNRQVWEYRADPDQAAPTGAAVWSGSTLFAILSAFLDALFYGKAPCSHFRVINANVSGVRIFSIFTLRKKPKIS